MSKPAKNIFVFLVTFIFLAQSSAFGIQFTLPRSSTSQSENIIQKEILENGLTVLIGEEHASPIVSIVLSVGAGLSTEGEYAGSGITHFIEHMIYKGTAEMVPGQIEKEVKSYGGTTNAWTGLDDTSYVITVPKKFAGEAVHLMAGMVFQPAFNKDEIEKERGVVLKEIRLNRDDPSKRVVRQLWQAAYLEHPYKLPLIGHESLFVDLKRSDIVKYHNARYVPENAILTVVGDIESGEMLAEVKAVFGEYERRGNTLTTVPVEPQQNFSRELQDSASINLGYFAMGYHTVELTSQDLYALDVLGIALGDWDGSKLNKKLVKDKELLYSVASFNYTPKYPGLFIVYGVGDAKNLKKAVGDVKHELSQIRAFGMDVTELETAKNMVIASYIDSLETTEGLARSISQSEFLAGDPEFSKKYVDNVKLVSNEMVRRVAKKYLNNKNLTVSYLYPASYEDTRSKGAKTRLKAYQPKKRALPNGIRLVLKQDPRLPKVSVVCAFLGGLRAETKENNGISNLTSSLLLKGTRTRAESEIKAFIESKGGRISSFSGKNVFGLSMEFLKDDTRDALTLLEDVIKNPIFPNDEIRKEKEKIFAAIKAEDDDIYNVGFFKLRKLLFGDGNYGLRVLGNVDSLERIERRDIQDFYKKFCVSGNMVISIVGDFKPREMIDDIERRFQRMSKTPCDIKTPPLARLAGVKEINDDMEKAQSLVVVGFRGTTLGNPDRYALEILSSVLSGHDGRLYEVIRNKLGLSYALGMFSLPGIDTGYIASFAATTSKNLQKARDVIMKELKAISRGGISDEEIRIAKASLIGKQEIALQSMRALAYKMALDEIFDLGYKSYQGYPQVISALTKEDIVRAAEKYFDLENYALVSITGEENE
ncbi:M16 family metallopeptidase [Candidatus Omnitrophota bacterium]